MKKLTRTLLIASAGLLWALSANAQAPANVSGVMLQGFYMDSYDKTAAEQYGTGFYGTTKWTDLYQQREEIGKTFSMIWLPPSSASAGGTGYHPVKWSSQNGAWGNQSQLTTLIKSFHSYGMKVIADIVVNHKNGEKDWTDLTEEDFGSYGKFTPNSSWICRDDEASAKGFSCTGNNDSGYETLTCEGKSASGAYCASRDLDHSNSNVQNAIKAYLKWLKNTIGYDGWRYDYMKGFKGTYINQYNNAAGAEFSVGEYWDGNAGTLKYWIGECSNNTNAFNFNIKYNGLNNGLASGNWGRMAALAKGGDGDGGSGLLGDKKQNAVNFVENHDTFRDGNNRFGGNWTQANAYIIALPGVPCVFYPHWVMCKEDIKKMVAARNACGITNTSTVNEASGTGSYFYCKVTGTKGTLYCYIGSGWSAPSGYKWKFEDPGDGWAYYTTVPVDDNPSVTMNPTSGYTKSVTLSANKGTIYYTTKIGGTPDKPTASSTKYTGPIAVTSDKLYISAIAIDGTKQSDVVTGGLYTNIEPEGITVQFKAPSNWSAVSLYVWDSEGKGILGDWPGKALSKQGAAYSYTITETTAFPINLIFNDNNNGHQTVDLSTSADYCWDGTGMSEEEITPVKCGDTPDTQYYVRVNGKTDYPAEPTGEKDFQERDQYMAKVPLNVGDNITAYDKVNNAEFAIPTIDPYGAYEKFTASSTGIKCNVAGCYHVFIKLKYGDNLIYIEDATDCTTGILETNTTSGVSLMPNPTSGTMSIVSDKEFYLGNVYTIGGVDCGTFEIDGNSIDVSRLAPSGEPYQLLLIDNNGNKASARFYKK